MSKVLKATISDKTTIMKNSLNKYFNANQKRVEKFMDVVEEKNTNYSLRTLEWFVSNYSKRHNIVLSEKGKDFYVYDDYKNQLKSFSKNQFDPFRRHFKFEVDYDDGKIVRKVETTIGQLNFFRWAIENKILEYVNTNVDKINKDMKIFQDYKDCSKEERKIRKSGSKSKICSRRNIPVEFTFG